MIRWYRRPRPPATLPVLVLRAAGSLAVIISYAVFRAPYLSTWTETLITLAIGGTAVLFSLNAVTELAVRNRDLLAPGAPSPLELTDVLPSPVPRTPVMMLDQTDLFGIHGELYRDTVAFEQGRAKLIDRGDFVTEPLYLFTHEYHPLTPPRGLQIPAPDTIDPATKAKLKAQFIEAVASGRHAKLVDDEAPQSGTGRHALADSQLSRERAHGYFGVW